MNARDTALFELENRLAAAPSGRPAMAAMKVKMVAETIATPLIAAKLAGWPYDFEKGGDILALCATGCLIRGATGLDIHTTAPRHSTACSMKGR